MKKKKKSQIDNLAILLIKKCRWTRICAQLQDVK